MKKMRKIINEIGDFFKSEINRVFAAVVCCGVLILILGYSNYKQSENILMRINKVEKKVDFRYFNLTRSMEDIHKIEINTLNGKIEK